MYEVYKTKAIILSKKNFLEKSKKIIIFTYDFGFIHINAHGISFEKSKNKNIIQSGNFVNIYMVMGKNKWTLTGGEVLDSIYFSSGKEALQSLYFNLNLLKKNSVFNNSQKEIFSYFENFYFLDNNFKKHESREKNFESKNKNKMNHILSIKKVLSFLGYWESSDKVKEIQIIKNREVDREKYIEFKINKINNILKKI